MNPTQQPTSEWTLSWNQRRIQTTN